MNNGNCYNKTTIIKYYSATNLNLNRTSSLQNAPGAGLMNVLAWILAKYNSICSSVR